MGKRKRRNRVQTTPEASPAPSVTPDEGGVATRAAKTVVGRILGELAGMAMGRFFALYAVVWLGASSLVLTLAWQRGPSRFLIMREFAGLSQRVHGKIVDSWLALEFDPSEMQEGWHWRGAAKARPCVIVEYDAGWEKGKRRAFCGRNLEFHEGYTLEDIDEIAAGVPFDWMRDQDGAPVVDVRLTADALSWLASRPPPEPVMWNPVPATELELLRLQLDRPIDYLAASWSRPEEQATDLLIDPKNPERAWPAALVDRGVGRPEWGLLPFALVIGLTTWMAGMRILTIGLPKPAQWIIAVVPLLLLPWWGEWLPRGLRWLHHDFGGVIADMLGDVDEGIGGVFPYAPGSAPQVKGQHVYLRPTQGIYADTLGRFHLRRPSSPPPSQDAALAALVDQVSAQARSLSDQELAELLWNLHRDKLADRRAAGIAFVPVAKEGLIGSARGATVQEAAEAFLSAWVTQPVEEPWPRDIGFTERVRLWRTLLEVPVPVIANPASWVVERAETRQREAAGTPASP